jgi:hypothetical protein
MTDLLIAHVCDNIYIGNIASIRADILARHKISIIINLAGSQYKRDKCGDVDIMEYTLPSQELLDSEVPRTISKLDTIYNKIKEASSAHNILICCNDGKNKSALVAAYYLLKSGQHSAQVIKKIENIYCTDSQGPKCLTTASFKGILRRWEVRTVYVADS